MPEVRCCCIPRGCLIFEDGFNRRNNTDLGSGWKEVQGDSEISGNKLLVPAGGVVMATTPNPARDHTGHVWVDMIAPVDGDKYRVLIQYDDTDDSFLFGEFEAVGEDGGWLRVGSGNLAGSSIFHEQGAGHYGEGQTTQLSVCRSKTGIFAQVEMSVIAWDCVEDPGISKPYKSGLMNAGSNAVEFDNFQFWEHWITNPDCPKCECDCNGYCVGSKTLTLTIFASDLCDCLNGNTVELTWDPNQLPEFIWQGSAMLQDHYCTAPELHEYRLRCVDTGPTDWILECLQGPFCSACDDTGFFGVPDSGICDPFELNWVGGHCTESGGEECAYSMRATDS